MGDLVGDDVRDHMLFRLRRSGRIDEEEGFAERDETEVLHRAGGEVGEADEVELVGGIRDREVLGEEFLAEGAALLHERGERSLAGLVHDAQRHSAEIDRVGDLELADDEGDEVGREEHGVGEPHPAAAVADRLVRDLPGVRERGEIARDDERDREDGLEVGLVPAGERAPGARRLELGRGDDLVVASRILVGGAIEAAQLVVQHSAEAEVEDGAACLRGAIESDAGALVLGVDRDGAAMARARCVDERRFVDLEVDRVQQHLRHGLRDLDFDRPLALERRGAEVGRQGQLVAAGDDGARQSVVVLLGHGGSVSGQVGPPAPGSK